MMKKYGDRSPLLVYDPIYSTISSEYFYTTDRAIPEIIQQLKAKDTKKKEFVNSAETYYRYIDDEKEKNLPSTTAKILYRQRISRKTQLFPSQRQFDPKTNKTTTLFMLANGPQKFSKKN